MGSVSRRFRRNIKAKAMAQYAGVVARPIEIRHPETGEVVLRHMPQFTPTIFYRALMLRMAAQNKKRMKKIHNHQQVVAGLKEKRKRFYKKGFFGRLIDNIFRRGGRDA